MRTLLAALRPLRTELVGVAGLAALLLLGAAVVAVRLIALDLPAACLDISATDPACIGRQYDVAVYQAFVLDWPGKVAYAGALVPALAGVLLGIATAGKELDQRTAVLAWSVGPSRRRWLLQRVLPLLGVLAVLGVISSEVFAWMARLASLGHDPFVAPMFEFIPVTGFGPIASGVSAFGITTVIGAMLGRLLPALLAAAAFVLFASLLISNGNDRLMAVDSLIAEPALTGSGRQIDSVLRTPNGTIISWSDAYPDYADPETGQLRPGTIEMVRYVPIEIYPQVAARYVLFHLLVGLVGLTLAFAVVERRSP